MKASDRTRPEANVPPLPAQVVLPLRALAVLGPNVSVETLSRVLDQPPARVWEALQLALDHGVPIRDHNDGTLTLVGPLVSMLRETTLPGLLRSWRSALPAQEAPPTAPVVKSEATVPATPPPAPQEDEAIRHTAPRVGRAHRSTTIATKELPKLYAKKKAPASEKASDAAPPEVEQKFLRSFREAQKLAAEGRSAEALAHARTALAQLPEDHNEEFRQLRVEALAAEAELQARGGAVGADFTLQAAKETLQRAIELLRPQDPGDLRVRVLSLFGSVTAELGVIEDLEEVPILLEKEAERLEGDKHIVGAALLRNEIAWILLRRGDAPGAAAILSENLHALDEQDQDRIDVLRATAATEHLLARLPLYGNVSKEREPEAIEQATLHAAEAEQRFRTLNDQRLLARVWETRARLALRKKELDEAEGLLSAALQAQERIGDVLGLARSTAALSELFAARGQLQGALRLLSDSIALNVEKGSLFGLHFNRAGLWMLAEQGAPKDAVDRLSEHLNAAVQTALGE